jgi:thioredoxin reductase (NADPH)
MTENIREISAQSFEKEIGGTKPAILDFFSTECPPCEALASKYDALSRVYGNDISFLKIFRQENRELATKLGVTSSPTLLFYTNGKESLPRLSGGIRRSEIAEHISKMIPARRYIELSSSISKTETECDVLILGGGPAGLAAAIYLAQARLSVIVSDTSLPGGYVATTHLVSNYPGFADPPGGYMLSHAFVEQAKKAGAGMRPAVDISDIDFDKKTVRVDGIETITAKKIIVAAGSSPKPLGLPGEKEYRGNGISYCATCDAKYFDGKDVIVIGGGNSAIEESLFIARYAKSITIIHQFAELQANKLAQERAFSDGKISFLFEHEPREFIKHGHMDMEVEAENLATNLRIRLRTNGIFIFAGFIPNIPRNTQQFVTDQYGYILTDEDMRTNIPDVYAIGDIRSKKYRQITTAVSDGTIAAIAISKELG